MAEKVAIKTFTQYATGLLGEISERKAIMQASAAELRNKMILRGFTILGKQSANPFSPSVIGDALETATLLANEAGAIAYVALTGDSDKERELREEAGVAAYKNRLKKEKETVRNQATTADKEAAVTNTASETMDTELIVTTHGGPNDADDRVQSEIVKDTRGESINNERSTGIIIKPNKRATLSLFSVSGKPRKERIRNFFITGVREDTSEKFQIVQTFGTDYIFFFNRKPLIYTINGILYNTEDKQWRNDFKADYDSLFRGTELVKQRNKVVFAYDDVIRHGYLLNLSYNTDASNPNAVPFSFSIFVTKESKIGRTTGREGEASRDSEKITIENQ